MTQLGDEHSEVEASAMESNNKGPLSHPVVTGALGAIVASVLVGVGASGAMLWRSAPVVDKEMRVIEKNINQNQKAIESLEKAINTQKDAMQTSLKEQNRIFSKELSLQSTQIAQQQTKIENLEKVVQNIERWYSKTSKDVSGLSLQLARIEGAINQREYTPRGRKK